MKNSDTTIKDIAKMCNTSFSTVSAILKPGRSNTRFSEKTRALVLETAQKIGYKPNRLARALISGKPSVIAISLHNQPFKSEDTFYFHDILRNASEFLAEKDFETLFITYTSHEEQIERLKRLKDEAMIAGVISNVIPGKDDFFVNELEEMGLPFVILGKTQKGPNVISDISNLEKHIMEYAQKEACSSVVTVKHNMMSSSGALEFYPLPANGCTVNQEMLKSMKDKALLVLYGNTIYSMLLAEYGDYGNKILLVEDDRRIPIVKPAVLAHSLNKERIKQAGKILMDWLENGIMPESNRKIISLEDKFLKSVN